MHNAFTNLRYFLQTSVLNNCVVLYCKGLQTIVANCYFHAALILSLLYPFSVACETVMTNLLSI